MLGDAEDAKENARTGGSGGLSSFLFCTKSIRIGQGKSRGLARLCERTASDAILPICRRFLHLCGAEIGHQADARSILAR
jgi:hypothetical protein